MVTLMKNFNIGCVFAGLVAKPAVYVGKLTESGLNIG